MARNSHPVAFPHPVVGLGDDLSGELRCNTPHFDFGVDNTTLSIDGLEVTNPTIADMVRSQDAAFIARVGCGATYYREAFSAHGPVLEHVIPSAKLSGDVEIQVRVCALKRVDGYRPMGLHPDYGDRSFTVQAGDVLALGDEFTVRAEKQFDPLAADISSIMRVARGDREQGPFRVLFQSNQIRIELSREDYKRYGLASHAAPGVIHAALVLPVLSEAIAHVQNPAEQDEMMAEAKWYHRLKAMLEARRIENDETPLAAAQKLLDAPFSRALDNVLKAREDD